MARVVALQPCSTVRAWCRSNEAEHAIVGGFYMRPGGPALGEELVEAFDVTPFGNDVLADFAMRAVVEEQLGRDTIPDILGISFSANDRVGHAYGPDSH